MIISKSPNLFCVAVLLATVTSSGQSQELKIWFQQPAAEWVESLPIGNGRLLATNQGGVRREVLQLNEDTLWSGKPVDRDLPGARESLQEARRLLFAGEYLVAVSATRATGRMIPGEGLPGEPETVPEEEQYIPEEYNSRSQLRVTLEPGENQHEFALSN